MDFSDISQFFIFLSIQIPLIADQSMLVYDIELMNSLDRAFVTECMCPSMDIPMLTYKVK